MIERITTLLVKAAATAPADPYDLVDISTVRDELGISAGDNTSNAFLWRAIHQVSAAVANYCNRVFQVETVQDLFYPRRDAYPYQVPSQAGPLQLSRWPLISPPLSLTAPSTTTSGTVLPFTSTTGIAVGQPVGHLSVPVGTVVQSVVANTSVALSASITAPVNAGDAVTFGLTVAVVDPPATTTLLANGTDYLIDADSGQLIRLNHYTSYPSTWDAVQTIVCYQGGYSQIPYDVTDAVLRTLVMRNAGRGRDPLLKEVDQPGTGRQVYWVGTAPGVRGAFTEEIADLLDNFRVPVVA